MQNSTCNKGIFQESRSLPKLEEAHLHVDQICSLEANWHEEIVYFIPINVLQQIIKKLRKRLVRFKGWYQKFWIPLEKKQMNVLAGNNLFP